MTSVPAIVHDVLGGVGRPLDAADGYFFESRFGVDFSRVRLHTGRRASESARAVHARAYTVGSDIVLGEAAFRGSTERALLAHELAHVAQHSDARPTGRLRAGAVDDPAEREAGSLARRVLSGRLESAPPVIVDSGGGSLQREIDDVAEELPKQEVEGDEAHDGDVPVNVVPVERQPSAIEAVVAEGIPEPTVGISGTAATQLEGDKGTKPMGPAKPPATKPIITDIDVDLTAQKLTLKWSDGTTEGHDISSGRGLPRTKDDPCKTQTEKNCTPVGDFLVGTLGNANTKNQHGDRMSWYVEFVPGRGIGIHDSQPVPGVPASHGCVRVGSSPADDAFAKRINKNVVSGQTIVHVSGKAPTKPWTKSAPAPKKAQPPTKGTKK